MRSVFLMSSIPLLFRLLLVVGVQHPTARAAILAWIVGESEGTRFGTRQSLGDCCVEQD
jgi:hypothetical protein